MKSDIRFAKKNGYERKRGLKTRIFVKKIYNHTANKPILGRLSRTSASIALSSRTKQRVEDLEMRLSTLERRIKQLESDNNV